MLGEDAQLVEVLPRSHYDEEHLPGAISLPLRKINARSIQLLELERPIVTYCYDYQCDLSSRAAHLLEALGGTNVYDYTASKAAWKACGLPTEGTGVVEKERAAAVSRRIPTSGLSSTVAQLRRVMREEDSRCVITDDADVVMGIVRDTTRGPSRRHAGRRHHGPGTAHGEARRQCPEARRRHGSRPAGIRAGHLPRRPPHRHHRSAGSRARPVTGCCSVSSGDEMGSLAVWTANSSSFSSWPRSTPSSDGAVRALGRCRSPST